jgi:hypothetical protein
MLNLVAEKATAWLETVTKKKNATILFNEARCLTRPDLDSPVVVFIHFYLK